MYTYIKTDICIQVYIHVCIHMYVYAYMYIYIRAYTHTQSHTRTHTHKRKTNWAQIRLYKAFVRLYRTPLAHMGWLRLVGSLKL